MSRSLSTANDAATSELLDGYSFEMTGKYVPELEQARRLLPPGTRVTVTYLAGEDLELRLAAAKAVKDLGLVPVPHIPARRLDSTAELEEFLDRLQQIGATEHVFALGGDPAEPSGPYPDALSIIRSGLLEKYGVREVSIAGYPEGHPDIPSDALWQHLDAKHAALQEQGLGSVILTQFAFDAEPVVRWIDAVRARGIGTQIRVGVSGPVGFIRLVGFARDFGVRTNATAVGRYAFSLRALVGRAGPTRFVADLAEKLGQDPASGDVRLHFYPFGGLLTSCEWASRHSAQG